MVKENNNLLPVEVNNKPFETVQEVGDNYEIPSYEEFMKNYESDGNLNYADLSAGDIGEVKGYGPCYKDCGYANPDCECYVDEKYVPLYLVCPAPRNSWPYCTDKESGQWTHGDYCGGRMYINTSLNIKCMKPRCGKIIRLGNAGFACSSHESDYSKAGRTEMGNSLTILNNAWKGKSHVVKRYIEKMIDKVIDEEGLID